MTTFTKGQLPTGTKLKVKKTHEALSPDSEIEVLYAGDSMVIVKTRENKELNVDYVVLSSMYEIIPSVIPTEENFNERLLAEVDLMIAHLSAFNSYQAGGVDANMVAIGTKLHAIKEEVTGYLAETVSEPMRQTA